MSKLLLTLNAPADQMLVDLVVASGLKASAYLTTLIVAEHKRHADAAAAALPKAPSVRRTIGVGEQKQAAQAEQQTIRAEREAVEDAWLASPRGRNYQAFANEIRSHTWWPSANAPGKPNRDREAYAAEREAALDAFIEMDDENWLAWLEAWKQDHWTRMSTGQWLTSAKPFPDA